MPKRIPVRWLLYCALGLPVAAWLWSLSRHDPHEIEAAPYTVRTDVEHPFDPDWPDVYLIVAEKCAGCHRPGGDELNLSSYEALLAARTSDGRPVVVPGRPQDSPFYRRIAWNFDAAAGSPLPDEPEMPPKEAQWLTARQQEAVRNWIGRGALEYKLPATCSNRPLLEIDFPSAKECRVCHPQQYEQWSRSMHAYAQHSPIMEGFQLTLIERTGGTIGTFCTRCHTPLGVALGENGSRRNVHRSRLSMEGVTCVVCHRASRPYYKSNTRRYIEPGKLIDGCMFGPFDDAVSLEMQAHESQGRVHIKSSAFCGACHDVTNPQGLRLEEAYSEWQNSPAAAQGVTCQACHMGPAPGVPVAACDRPVGRAAEVPGVDPDRIPLRPLSDHNFAGPDYSLLPDTEFPYKLDWMYEVDYRNPANLNDYRRRTLTALRRENRKQLRIAREKRYELLRNAARLHVDAPHSARCGEKIDVRVDVESIFSGHNLPTGFTAERQVWVEVCVTDPAGNVVFRSGDFDSNGDLRDEHSYEVERGLLSHDRHLFNMQSKFVALTFRGTERPVVIAVNRHLTPLNVFRPAPSISASYGRPPTFRVSKASLQPLKTHERTYPVQLPSYAGPCHLCIKLNFRHLPPVLLDRIGTPHLKHLLETVVMDQYDAVIQVGPREPENPLLRIFSR